MRTRAIHHNLRRILAAVTLLCPIVVGVGATSAGASDDGFGGEVILSVPFADSDVSAFSTTEPSETVPSCGPLRTTEWYQFTTPFSNTMTATLTGNFDLLLAVYTDPNGTGPAGLNEVACENPFAEELTLSSIPVTAGETYYFQISSEDTFAGGGGNFTFALDYDGPVPPDNDDFDDAQIVFESNPPTTGTNALATVEPGEVTSACANSGDPVQSSVWYRLSVSDNKPLLVTTAGSDFDTELSIFSGSSLASLEEVACDDDNNGGLQAARVFHPNPGGTYYARVDGFGGGTGNITLDMVELACGAPSTWRVDASGTGDFFELQDALAAAAACDPIGGSGANQVHVAAGTYASNEFGASRDISFVMDGQVRVVGGYASGFASAPDPVANPTILSGQNSNAYNVVEAIGSNVEIEGMTIQGGSADGAIAGQRSGAGVLSTSQNLVVNNSTIHFNTAIETGAAIDHQGGSFRLVRSTIENNTGDGAAVFVDNGGIALVSESTFASNTGVFGSDLQVNGSPNGRINNSIFESTTAAPVVIENASVRIMNSVVDTSGSPNIRFFGGADVELNNSILTGGLGLSIESATAAVLVRNSIIWGAPETISANTIVSSLSFEDSIVQDSGGSGSWASGFGTDLGGNLDTDPLWVDPANDNFRLSFGSPAVDAGEDAGLPLDLNDLDGDGETTSEKVPDLDLNDRVQNGTIDLGPYEQSPIACQPIIYVDGDRPAGGDGLTWPTAFTGLQPAITQANACSGVASEIWIAEGVYTPHASDRTVRFSLPHQVDVVGGFDGTENNRFSDRPSPLTEVVLSGDLAFDDAGSPGPDNSQGVVLVDLEVSARLYDLTVTGGNADGANGGSGGGGGILVEGAGGPFEGGELSIENVRVIGNVAIGGGGISTGGDVFVSSSLITQNSADTGGGVLSYDGFVVLTDSGVSLNTAVNLGGGIQSTGEAEALNLIRVDLSSNTVLNGDGGGVYSTSNLNVVATAFKLNSAPNASGGEGGAIFSNGTSLAISSSEFSGNNAGRLAGGVFVSAPNALISSSTFAGNGASVAGGAVFVDSQPTTGLNIHNTVLWDNTSPAGPELLIDGSNFGAVRVRSSIVEGSGGSGPGWDGDLGGDQGGNVDGDPLFTNFNAFDFTPLPGSPAIGAADAAVLPLDPFTADTTALLPDFVGAPRIQGNGPEIGSREVQDGVPGAVQALSEPCVVYDSTLATGALSGPILGNEIRTVSVTGNLPAGQGGAASCVPSDATAVTFLIAADAPTRIGNFKLSAAGTVPSGGVVNFAPNTLDNANTVTVPLPTNGQVDIGANGGTAGINQPLAGVRLVALAYNAPSATSEFVPITPCAVADSRSAQGGDGPYKGPFAGGASYPPIDVVGAFPSDQGGGNTDCGIPAFADAIVVNVVAVNPAGGNGRVLIGANGTTPSEGTPFAPIGMNNAAVAIVPLDGAGTVEVDIEAQVGATTNVRLVALGYFQTKDEAIFVPVNPCAAFDTRFGAADFGGLRQGGETTTYQLSGLISDDQGGVTQAGSCGVPTNATGVLINLVAVGAVGPGNLQIAAANAFPTGGALNFAALSPAMNNANAVPVELSPSGEVKVVVNAGGSTTDRTHVRGVVLGYYINPPLAPPN